MATQNNAVIIALMAETLRLNQGLDQAHGKARKTAKGIASSFVQSSRDISQAFFYIRTAVPSFLAGVGISSISSLSDSYTQAQNIVKNASKDALQFESLFNSITTLSQETGTSLNSNATLVARLANNLESGADTATRLASIISKGFIVSGASVQEASNATIQLIQGLSAGILRGEEFNSVNEQGDRIARALSESLGIQRGELKKLADEGLLTTRTVELALKGQASSIAEEFEKVEFTFERAFGTISVGAQKAAKTLTTAFLGGGTDTLKNFSTTLSLGLDAIAEAFDALNTASGNSTAAIDIAKSIALSIGGIATGLSIASEGVQSFFDTFRALVEGATIAATERINQFPGEVEFVFSLIKTIVNKYLREIQILILQVTQEYLASIKNLVPGVTQVMEKIKTEIATLTAQSFLDDKKIKTQVASLGELIRGNFGQVFGSISAEFDKLVNKLAGSRSRINELAVSFFELRKSIIDINPDSVKTEAPQLAEEERKELERISAELKTQLEALKNKQKVQVKLTEEEKESLKFLKEYREEIEKSLKEIDPVLSASQEVANATAEYVRFINDATTSEKERADAVIVVTAAVKKLNEEIQKAAETPFLVERKKILADIRSELELERQLFGLKEEGNEAQIQLLRIIDSIKRQGIDVTEQEIDKLRTELLPLLQEITTLKQGPVNSFAEAFSRAVRDAFSQQNLGSFFDILKKNVSSIFSRRTNPDGTQETNTQRATRVLDATSEALNFFSRIAEAEQPLRGLNDALAQTGGVVGSVSRVLQAIDSIFGGRLFGTSFEATGSGSNFSFNQSGFTGSNFENQSRQRSFFRGTERRTITNQLDPSTRRALEDYFKGVNEAMRDVARIYGAEVPQIISGTFKEEFDKDGKLVKQFSTILGEVFNESFEEFQVRIRAVNLLAVVDDIDGSLSAIADRFKNSAFEYGEAVELLITLAVSTAEGFSLAGLSIGEIVSATESYSRENETLLDTYNRLVFGLQIVEELFTFSSTSIGRTGTALIEFSDALVEALGGIEVAGNEIKEFLSFIFSPEELLEVTASQALANAQQSLGELGLPLETTLEELKQFYLENLPNLTPEQLASVIDAGISLGRFNEAITELGADSAAAAEELAEAQRIIAEELAEAQRDYANLANELDREFAALTSTEFVNSYRDIRREESARITEINRLADASGDLSLVLSSVSRASEIAAIKINKLVRELIATGRSLVQEAYGTELERIEREIGLIQEGLDSNNQNELNYISDVSNASEDRYQRELEAIQRIKEYLDQQLLSDVSSLNPRERLAESERQFFALLARAQTGDIEALEQITQAADTYLREARSFFASGQGFNEIEATIRGALQGLLSLTPTAPGNPINVSGPQQTVPAELQELLDQRDLLIEQLERERLSAILEEIIGVIRDLSVTAGLSLEEIAQELGLNLTQFVKDLGINLDDITETTANSLADLAGRLGVELAELAQEISVDLGALSDRQSLLNNLVENAIIELPQPLRDELQPLLENIEFATNEADANAAIQELENRIRELAPDLRILFEPFFDSIDPQTEIDLIFRQIDIADRQTTLLESVNTTLIEILERTPIPIPPLIETVPEDKFANTATIAAISNRLDSLIQAVRESGEKTAKAVKQQPVTRQ